MSEFLNMRTIVLVYAVTSVIATLIMTLVWKSNRTAFNGIGDWLISYVLISAGNLLLLGQGFIPDFFSVFLGDMLIILSTIAVFYGVEKFSSVRVNHACIHTVAILSAVFFLKYLYITPHFGARVLVSSVAVVVVLGHCVYLVFFKLYREHRKIYRVAGIVFCLYIAVQLGRGILIVSGRYGHSLFYNCHGDNILILTCQMLLILLTFSFILAINNRLIQELNDNIHERENLVHEFKRIASTDTLTGIYNRMKLEPIMTAEVLRSKRYKRPLSILLIDLDLFKLINDTYGHSVGDSVLREVSSVMKENLRDSDQFGRWGGEEFLVVAPETAIDGARAIAEKLRMAVDSHRFIMDIKLTISVGAASLEGDEWEEHMFRRADEAMYKAKNSGRNRVV